MSNLSNLTDTKLEELEGTVKVLTGNADQFFLIVMGCLIFCKYMLPKPDVHIILVSSGEFVKTFLTLKIPNLGRFQNVAVHVFSTWCKVWKCFRRFFFSLYSVMQHRIYTLWCYTRKLALRILKMEISRCLFEPIVSNHWIRNLATKVYFAAQLPLILSFYINIVSLYWLGCSIARMKS